MSATDSKQQNEAVSERSPPHRASRALYFGLPLSLGASLPDRSTLYSICCPPNLVDTLVLEKGAAAPFNFSWEKTRLGSCLSASRSSQSKRGPPHVVVLLFLRCPPLQRTFSSHKFVGGHPVMTWYKSPRFRIPKKKSNQSICSISLRGYRRPFPLLLQLLDSIIVVRIRGLGSLTVPFTPLSFSRRD